MAETKWTPGEWIVADFNDGEAVMLAGQTYKSVITYSAGEMRDGKPTPSAEKRANARLISAAPELYEALTEAKYALYGNEMPEHDATYRQIVAALAKAGDVS